MREDDDELYGLLNDGLALYRSARYFEAHEVWEYAWKAEVGRNKLTLQALIQIAAALYKQQQGVPAGTSKLLHKALGLLSEIRSGASAWLGIDLVALAADTARALEAADRACRGERVHAVAPALPELSGPDGILYLHGFASGPSSTKAQRFVAAFEKDGYRISVPDQNEGDPTRFTVSRALALARRGLRDRTLVIGSSLGGYLGALLAASDERVKALLLMAPAFAFSERLEARRGLPGGQTISAELVEDAKLHPARPPIRVPTVILHGRSDDTVPCGLSVEVKAAYPELVSLELLDDDHGLIQSADRAIESARGLVERLGLQASPPPSDPAQALLRLAEREQQR